MDLIVFCGFNQPEMTHSPEHSPWPHSLTSLWSQSQCLFLFSFPFNHFYKFAWTFYRRQTHQLCVCHIWCISRKKEERRAAQRSVDMLNVIVSFWLRTSIVLSSSLFIAMFKKSVSFPGVLVTMWSDSSDPAEGSLSVVRTRLCNGTMFSDGGQTTVKDGVSSAPAGTSQHWLEAVMKGQSVGVTRAGVRPSWTVGCVNTHFIPVQLAPEQHGRKKTSLNYARAGGSFSCHFAVVCFSRPSCVSNNNYRQ